MISVAILYYTISVVYISVVFIVFSLRVLGRFFNSLEWSEIVCRRARGVGSQTTAGAAVYAQEPTPTKCLLARQPPAHLTNR